MFCDLSSWLVVVPARLDSERLPRKPLVDLGGFPLIIQVVKNLLPLSQRGAKVVCATDSHEVQKTLDHYQLNGIMTKSDHTSGTDRCAEVARSMAHPMILNVQGDEPFVNCDDLINLCLAMEAKSDADMGTLVYQCSDDHLFHDPNVVKAVKNKQGFALYFSRSPIPFDRSPSQPRHTNIFWQHLGVYAFKREQLLAFNSLPTSELEQREKLEQLRALDAGWKILTTEAKHFARGIDTPEDLAQANKRFNSSERSP